MARQNGPVKGLLVLQASNEAKTHEYILEPYHVDAATFNAIESGDMSNFYLQTSGSQVDPATGTLYVEIASYTATPLGQAVAGRKTGPVKGTIVIVCDELATSAEYIIEPIEISPGYNSDWENASAPNTVFCYLWKVVDELGHTYFAGQAND